MGDLNTCIMTALDGCAESEKTMYLGQLPAITDPVNQACMAFNGDGGRKRDFKILLNIFVEKHL